VSDGDARENGEPFCEFLVVFREAAPWEETGAWTNLCFKSDKDTIDFRRRAFLPFILLHSCETPTTTETQEKKFPPTLTENKEFSHSTRHYAFVWFIVCFFVQANLTSCPTPQLTRTKGFSDEPNETPAIAATQRWPHTRQPGRCQDSVTKQRVAQRTNYFQRVSVLPVRFRGMLLGEPG